MNPIRRLELLSLIALIVSSVSQASDDSLQVEPSYGPRAGGTSITLKGSHLQDVGDIVKVTLSEAGVIYDCTILDSSKNNEIVAQTPTYSGADDDVELVLEVRNRTSGEVKHTHRSTFKYRPDPAVQGVQPQSTILAGGIALTVNGRHLDSVAKPQILTSMLRSGRVEQTLSNQQAYFVNSTHAKFRLPAVPVLAQDPLYDITLLVGVQFDAVRYPNYTQLSVVNNPVVEPWALRNGSEGIEYAQGKEDHILISVTWPRGYVISTDDVTVMVGKRKCLDLTISNSSGIRCVPPPVPEPTIRNGPESISKPIVVVHIGNQQTVVGKIIFSLPEGIHIIIIIMSAILVIMFLISFLFGCIACCSGRKKEKAGLTKERSSISYVPVDDQDEMARRRSRVRLSKDSTVEIPHNYQRVRSNSSTSSETGAADNKPLHKIEESKEPAAQSKVGFTDGSRK